MVAEYTKHVLMVAYTTYPSDARVRREAETMASQKGYSVTALVLKEKKKPRRYNLDGVEVVELNIGKYRGGRPCRYMISYLHYLLLAFLQITLSFARGRIDIVHVHNMPNILVLAAILPKIGGRPIILDIHDSMPETYAAKFSSIANQLLFRMLVWEERISSLLANRIICVNHVQKKAIVARGLQSDKITVVLNTPDPKRFMVRPNRSLHRSKAEHYDIVYHGTITKRLGIDIALQAINRLKPQIPGIRFHVLGTGDDLDEFILLSKSMALDNCVRFNDRMLPVDKLLGELESMDLGIIANRQNSATDMMLPVKMLEYFALGIPVVAPILPAIQYYCDDGMVSFYPPEDIDSLARAIYHLYANPCKRQLQAAKAGRFLDRYGWEKYKAKLLHVYQA